MILTEDEGPISARVGVGSNVIFSISMYAGASSSGFIKLQEVIRTELQSKQHSESFILELISCKMFIAEGSDHLRC